MSHPESLPAYYPPPHLATEPPATLAVNAGPFGGISIPPGTLMFVGVVAKRPSWLRRAWDWACGRTATYQLTCEFRCCADDR
jgi:hypothetical protein